MEQASYTPLPIKPTSTALSKLMPGSWGCGAFFHPHWFQYAWPAEWAPINIMAKELVPISISCAVCPPPPLLAHKQPQFQCDNQSLVSAINKGSSKDNMVMHLLRCLWFIITSFDIHITASHLPGIHNKAADMLSRDQGKEFLAAHPQISLLPINLPPSLLNLLAPQMLDWTSPPFLCHFTNTLILIQQPPQSRLATHGYD